jgi:hypothetical protein
MSMTSSVHRESFRKTNELTNTNAASAPSAATVALVKSSEIDVISVVGCPAALDASTWAWIAVIGGTRKASEFVPDPHLLDIHRMGQ